MDMDMAHGVKFANPNRQGGLFSQTVELEEPRARTNWSLSLRREGESSVSRFPY